MSYFIVKACSYCGQYFTEWHECAGTERAKHHFFPAEATEDEKLVERLKEFLEERK